MVPGRINLLLLVGVSVLITGCSSTSEYSPMASADSIGRHKVGKSYTVNGKTFYPTEIYSGTQTGLASWYGPGFDGRMTANGERFDQNALTAAHPTLQMPSMVRVTNLNNNRSVVVRVNDRGPFHSDRIIDLSKGAAEALGFRNMGTAQVRLDVMGPESMALTEAAKRKIDTRGAEIAVNQTGRLDDRLAQFYPSFARQPSAADATMVAMAGNNPVVSGTGYVPQVSSATALEAAPLGVQPIPMVQTIDQDMPIRDTDAPGPAVAEAVLPPLNTGAIVPASKPIPPQHMPVERVAVREQTYQMAPVAEAEAPIPPQTPRGLLGRLSIGTKAANAAEIIPQAAGTNYVQVGAYLSHASANVLRDELAQYGPAKVIPARPGDTSYFRVQIGPFDSVAQADDVVAALKSQGRMASVLK
ncbi:MAG TPA: septal ring lytic transglycosylase RlpA family protein [Alphaproteobacteria bacterium]